MIPFNQEYSTGKELAYLKQAIASKHLEGDGTFTRKCSEWFAEHANFDFSLLTTSCTDALEICAALLDIEPGDEVIAPSYTFVSSVLPFVKAGATIRFADSRPDHPNIAVSEIQRLTNPRTKAVVVVHYSGVACEMDEIQQHCKAHNLILIEDAAQAVGATYKGQFLGGIGDLGAISFHGTKNISAGEGGLLIVGSKDFRDRAEILREKGTNRAKFFRGEIDKYGWVDTGSSHLPGELIAAFLLGQLEQEDQIRSKRVALWERYASGLQGMEDCFQTAHVPEYASNNGHVFYLVTSSLEERGRLIQHLKDNGIKAVFHYLSLHTSEYFGDQYNGPELVNARRYTDCLVRLPLFPDMTDSQVDQVISQVKAFYGR